MRDSAPLNLVQQKKLDKKQKSLQEIKERDQLFQSLTPETIFEGIDQNKIQFYKNVWVEKKNLLFYFILLYFLFLYFYIIFYINFLYFIFIYFIFIFYLF